VLFLLFGSSGAGKTTIRRTLTVSGAALHDFDEVGVPADAGASWRRRVAEDWLGRAVAYQRQGLDLLLSAQLPLGEALAVPSAVELSGIAACLIDCTDGERTSRLTEGGGPSDAQLHAYLMWAAWLRGHARDPQHRQEVIVDHGDVLMTWDRWTSWTRGDPRWTVSVVDTTNVTIAEATGQVEGWVQEQRALHTREDLPLSGQWWDG
jgi:hypothetical protein